LFAYVNQRAEAVDYLLEREGNWNMTGVNNGTALHRAAWEGDLSMVERLVARGADIGNRENPYGATPLSWADHNKQREVFEWLVANCPIDLHDAVSFGLRDHVHARLREDPASVNRQIDHWRVPRSTPLYWACWTSINSPSGVHAHDASRQRELVTYLLDRGADPDIVCGDGRTALDLALEAGAESVVSVLRRREGQEAEDRG
jgi:ankyrin repeat protein